MKDSKSIKYFFKVVDTLLPNNDKWGIEAVLFLVVQLLALYTGSDII